MKLRLLMSHCKNVSESIAVGKGWVCSDSERSTFHRVWAISEESAEAMECDVVSFLRLGDFTC